MKLILLCTAAASVVAASAFLPLASNRHHHRFGIALGAAEPTTTTTESEELLSQLDNIAHKLRLQVYDDTTGVYGFESKDPLYGIENIHTMVSMDANGWLGLELTEVAHAASTGGGGADHRGLVLVSKVEGHALHDTPIHVGDVIIGVFDDQGFKESTTALDYDETVNVITRAKKHSLDHGGHGKLTLELNRLVKRATVQVEIVQQQDDTKAAGQVTKTIQGLAGDNLRLLLLHNHVALYDDKTHRLDQPFLTGSNCGGEGICGTCLVAVQQGMDHLNKIGPQEESILKNRPASNWRAACKTVVGADNQEATTLRILLHPQHSQPKDEEETRVRP